MAPGIQQAGCLPVEHMELQGRESLKAMLQVEGLSLSEISQPTTFECRTPEKRSFHLEYHTWRVAASFQAWSLVVQANSYMLELR